MARRAFYIPFPRYMEGDLINIARIRREIRKAALNEDSIKEHEQPDEKYRSQGTQIAFIDEYANTIAKYMKDIYGDADILKIAQVEKYSPTLEGYESNPEHRWIHSGSNYRGNRNFMERLRGANEENPYKKTLQSNHGKSITNEILTKNGCMGKTDQ